MQEHLLNLLAARELYHRKFVYFSFVRSREEELMGILNLIEGKLIVDEGILRIGE